MILECIKARFGRLYFAYGTNLWQDQMTRRCPENNFVGLGILRGWKWSVDNRVYSNVARSPEDLVYGLVYKISPSDEANLDLSERIPWVYTKETMEIELQLAGSGGKSVVQGLVYINQRRVEREETWESFVHRMNMAIDDAATRGLPRWYIDKYMRKFIPGEGGDEVVETSKPEEEALHHPAADAELE